MPYKVFAAGEEALAADVNTHLMSQTVSRHASASARSSAITAPTKGQLSVLDTDVFDEQVYNGSAWVSMPSFNAHYVHATGFGTFGPTATASMNLPSFTYPRPCTMIVHLQVYVSLGSGSGALSVNLAAVSNGVSGAPTLAPVSMFSLNPFMGMTLPVTALYRNLPAGINIAPAIQWAGAGGSAVGDVGAISGSYLLFPAASEA